MACINWAVIFAVVECEERLARLDHLAFLVALLCEERFNAGADVHRVAGIGARRQLGEDRNRLLHDGRDHHRDSGLGALAAALLASVFPPPQPGSKAAAAKHTAIPIGRDGRC